jgi:uncharacterized protein (DUF2147 family)
MKRYIFILTVAFAFAGMAAQYSAAGQVLESDAILGIWLTQDKEAKIEIIKCSAKYCGRITWTNDPLYTVEEDVRRAGQPKTDDNNSNPALRTRPIMGLQLMYNFSYSGERQWVGGRVYDPGSGNTYGARLSLISPDRLEMRGYFLIPLLGGKTTWTRTGDHDRRLKPD